MRDRSCSTSALQRVLLFATLTVLFNSLSIAAAEKRRFDIAAGEAAHALNEFSRQSELQIYFDADAVRKFMTNAVAGEFEAAAALSTMLGGTGLAFEFVNERTVAILLAGTGAHTIRMASAFDLDNAVDATAAPQGSTALPNADSAGEEDDSRRESSPAHGKQLADNRGLPEVLVEGSRLLNMDIKRSRDDTQPYVVLERSAIEQSGATGIEDFLRQRLPMNAVTQSFGQQASALGNTSFVSLRGLGTNQTLILVDGHRMASVGVGGTPQQPDLNRIPLSAVERIEILPTTASGIYGGSATGGVINVVLRRDYRGIEAKLGYENTFHNDAASRRADLTAGFALEGGKTNLLLAASHSKTDELLVRDRDFVQRGREIILANNPGSFLNSSTPPLGATTNIRSTTGANLTLKNGTPLNSPFTYVPAGYAGSTSDGGAAFLTNAGQYNFNLANTAQTAGGGTGGLLNGPTIESLIVTLRREFSSRLDAFLEVSASNNLGYFPINRLSTTFTVPATSPNNPFNQDIRVTTPAFGGDNLIVAENRDRRALAGVIVKLPKGWQAEADYTWDRARFYSSNPGGLAAAATAEVSSGRLDVLRDTNAFPVDFSPFLAPATVNSPADTTLKDATLRFAGPLWSLPAGALNLTALIEHRDESLEDVTTTTGSVVSTTPSRSQAVDSVYVEFRVPLVSPQNNVRGIHELELQLAARRDDYETEGSAQQATVVRAKNKITSADPTVGLRFMPVRDLMFRTSYGTGFLPPAVNQLVADAPSAVTGPQLGGLTDPRRGNQQLGAFTLRTGGNADLQPEQSESWSAGVVFTPRFAPGLRFSVDWTKIDKVDNITPLSPAFGGLQNALANENLIPERITRGPVPVGDPFEVGPITALDITAINLSKARVEAYDLSLDYQRDTGNFGTFGLFALATRLIHQETQVTPAAVEVENLGTSSALKSKANAGLTWSYRPWTLGWSTRYFDSYWINSAHTVNPNQGSARIPRQIYHDAFINWATSDDLGISLLSNVEVQLTVKNVLNEEPPFDANPSFAGGNFYSPLGDPRLASYYISIKKAF